LKILITGSTGFIGTNLQEYLKDKMQDVEFYYIVRSKTGKQKEWGWEELAKIPKEIDAVIHLAGLAHDTKKSQDDSAYYRVNFELTKNLYDWYLKSKATKFIYTSSVKAIADSVDGELTEDTPARPLTPYGISKLKAEKYIQQLSIGMTGKAFYILRPCMVHGPGNKGNLNLLYKFVSKGIPYPLGAFNNVRSFLSIDNFCFICKELLTRDVQSGAYNVADDEPLSTNELVKAIAAVSGAKAKVWNLSPALVKSLAKTGDVLKLPLNSERLQKLTENYVVSNKKIKLALGIASLPVNVRDGITKTISSFIS
jgi:nucleoside-diphosphate-sugar epimerase